MARLEVRDAVRLSASASSVLNNPDELRYSEQRGMPLTPTLESDIFSNRSPLERFKATPALQTFLPWFNRRGASRVPRFAPDQQDRRPVVLVSFRQRTWTVPIIMLASTLPHAVIIWSGDDTSIGRHALLLAVYLRLGLILFTLQLLDAIVLHRR